MEVVCGVYGDGVEDESGPDGEQVWPLLQNSIQFDFCKKKSLILPGG